MGLGGQRGQCPGRLRRKEPDGHQPPGPGRALLAREQARIDGTGRVGRPLCLGFAGRGPERGGEGVFLSWVLWGPGESQLSELHLPP